MATWAPRRTTNIKKHVSQAVPGPDADQTLMLVTWRHNLKRSGPHMVVALNRQPNELLELYEPSGCHCPHLVPKVQ